MINLKKKLQNPVILTVQGFVLGSVLFYSTMPHQPAQPQPAPAVSQALEKIS